ncbi:MAG: GNAT family N-acetyltransferase [Actinomycetota bacterium]
MADHGVDNEQLLTARLRLRRPTPADIDAIYHIHRDPQACAHNPSDMLATRGDAEDLYRRWDEHWKRHGFGYWVIRSQAVVRAAGGLPARVDGHQPEATVLGFCGLKLMQLKNLDVLNLFYRLNPPAWGDGVATEAATAVVAWASAHVPNHPVIARVRPENIGSIRVAVRAGLRRAEYLDTDGEDGPDWIYIRTPQPTAAYLDGPTLTSQPTNDNPTTVREKGQYEASGGEAGTPLNQ